MASQTVKAWADAPLADSLAAASKAIVAAHNGSCLEFWRSRWRHGLPSVSQRRPPAQRTGAWCLWLHLDSPAQEEDL